MLLQGEPMVPGRSLGIARLVGPEPPVNEVGAEGSVLIAPSALALDPWLDRIPSTVGAVLETPRNSAGDRGARGFPIVAHLDSDLFREGEQVALDGGLGTVELEAVRQAEVVTAFLQRDDGRVLLLRRSNRVRTFPGRWAGVSGNLEDPTPREQAVREIREETGILPEQITLVRHGNPLYARAGTTVFRVHPFRFVTVRSTVELDWEHSEAEWVDPSEILRRPCVPKLDRAWNAVRDEPDRAASRVV